MTRTEIQRLLNAQFDCVNCRASTRWISIGRPLRRQNSTIHRLRCARCAREVIAKASLSDDVCETARLTMQREYETLCQLQQVFPCDEHFGILAAQGYLEDSGHGVVVTGYIPGTDLERYMQTLEEPQVQRACEAAGRWLRKLHDVGSACAQSGQIDVADKLEYLGDTYGDWLLRDGNTKSAHQCLEKVAPDLANRIVRVVRLHGDFKAQNMLCDGIRYIGLDIHWRNVGPSIFDLAPFLNHLWLNGRGLRCRVSDHTYQQRQARFLSGYGYEDDPRAVHWAQLYFALCQVGRLRQKGLLSANYANWRMGPLVKKLVAQLEAARWDSAS